MRSNFQFLRSSHFRWCKFFSFDFTLNHSTYINLHIVENKHTNFQVSSTFGSVRANFVFSKHHIFAVSINQSLFPVFFGAGSYRPDRDLKFFIGVQIFMTIDQKAMGNINMHRKRWALNPLPIFQHKVDNIDIEYLLDIDTDYD